VRTSGNIIAAGHFLHLGFKFADVLTNNFGILDFTLLRDDSTRSGGESD